MEPAPVTRRVRRTVRMAVALVVGQTLLCALIGFVTFQSHRSAPSGGDGAPGVDRLAAPAPGKPMPTEAPPPSTLPEPVPTRSERGGREQRPESSRTAGPARSSSSRSVVPAPLIATTKPLAPVTEDPGLTLVPPAPPGGPSSTPTPEPTTSESVQQPVTLGDYCAPEGALGRTGKGTPVRCEREGRHRPRWKIV